MSTPNYGESCHGKVAPVGDANHKEDEGRVQGNCLGDDLKAKIWGDAYQRRMKAGVKAN
jgi:hypothetical protein